jgi:DNA-directed RNA polymerase subunit alpha
MFQVQCLKSTKNKTTEIYSKYSIGPFLKGQSTTIGNALRRVLLSNLNGIAITGVRITGIDHEFSTIPNVKEDIVDILLNLKQIVLKGDITEPTLARLNVKKPGIIVANEIELPSNITLVDPHQFIASLTKEGNLEMEFLITKGQGYRMSDKLGSNLPEGFLALDGVFMPVTKVNFFVERVGGLESLIYEIWTNGSITPEEALTLSSEVLENTFALLKVTNVLSTPSAPMIMGAGVVQVDPTAQEEESELLETIFIEELCLSARAYNCLKRENVNTLSDLLQYSAEELLGFKRFGQTCAAEVREKLKTRFDLELRK